MQSSTSSQQYGYLDALQTTYLANVIAVQNAGLQLLADHPVLSPLIATTASITADDYAMRELVKRGRGAMLVRAFEQFERQLEHDELAQLLNFAIHQAPPGNASLAMATWWPRLRHDPPTRELLINLLADAELGSSALLALSQEPDIQTIKMLQDAAEDNSIAALRAQQALDLNRSGLSREGLR